MAGIEQGDEPSSGPSDDDLVDAEAAAVTARHPLTSFQAIPTEFGPPARLECATRWFYLGPASEMDFSAVHPF